MPNANPLTIDDSVTAFLRTLAGANKSPSTITAYRTDLAQFARFLAETNCTVAAAADITRADVSEFLGHLADRRLSGVTRARKLAALREWFRYLEGEALITKNPTMESPTSTPSASRSPTAVIPVAIKTAIDVTCDALLRTWRSVASRETSGNST